ncbi:ribonuclease P protein subunit, partial [Candidatus Micrarchaeota archaeon]|nr:ribonuclease P protein subunit [Candidatus Micrarchaeota archaeon]
AVESREFLLGELIGKKVLVEKSSCKDMQGIDGLILDETQNTFLLEAKSGRKIVPKTGCTFFFPESGIRVEGKLLICRPEERTKKLGKNLP